MTDTYTENLDLTHVLSNAPGQEARANEAFDVLDAFAGHVLVQDRDENDPTNLTPSHGENWLVGASGTDLWTGHDGKLAMYQNTAWKFVDVFDGLVLHLADEGIIMVRQDGEWNYSLTGVEATITASATQTQGQQPLTKRINIVTTVATVDDVVTLAPAEPSKEQIVVNNTATQLQVFPASGDSVDGGSVDASTTVAANASQKFIASDATNWWSV